MAGASQPFDLARVDFGLDPLPGHMLHDVLRAYREAAPVRPTHFLGLPAFVITGYDALLEAFTDAERFPGHRMYQASLEPAIGESFISMPERDRHLLYRKLATPAFRSRAIASYEEKGLVELASEVADALVGRDEVDLMADFAARYPYLAISRVLGLPRDREDEFHQWALALLRHRDDPQSARAAEKQLTAYLAPVVEARRQEPQEDVISGLLEAEVDGRRLTDAEIGSHVRMLFPTGGETTHGTLGNLLHAMLTHEGMWERLRGNPELVGEAVDEVLRWDSSIAVLPRLSCSEPTSFQGVAMPANSWVLFGIAGANRDPAVFPEPDRFDLGRDNKAGLTFGRGEKSCPGMHFARRNLSVGLRALLDRFPRPRICDAAESAPRRAILRCPDVLRTRLAGA